MHAGNLWAFDSRKRCNILQNTENPLKLYDFEPERDTFRNEVLQGLQKPKKELLSKYFYDEVGSDLFEQICDLDEYYPTRTELNILQEYVEEMAVLFGPHCLLIEYGSGSSRKTRKLLDALQNPTAYVPIEISKELLMQTVASLAATYPSLEVLPVCADYTSAFEIPAPTGLVSRRIGYYPGSTIGNFDPEPAKHFLQQIARTCKGGGLLIGVDLKKDFNIMHRAYNDQQGLTAQFNKHLLTRINQELDANFLIQQFGHYAFYNPGESRIEMHLVSLKNQTVHIGEVEISFKLGESIWTESSYKYTLEEFAHLASMAGFTVEHVWTDARQLFSVQYLSVN
ncbi:MAG: L-histidine N(alpha)-methyltransferase [Ktedonobacteraceae bacterium]